VRLKAGAVETLVNPNARYEEISTLRVEPRTWKTRYGTANTGFVTYPRGYRAGERRPTIVVTHANDARNNFAAADFQWEFPIQVFAEAGFVVLSVNEPAEKQDDGSSHDARFGLSGGEQGTVQFGQILNAVAGVEAAARWAINEGLAVPDAIGIAGYSRGAEVTEYAMTQSNMFSAAVEGDAGGFTAGQYWAGGWAPFRKMYQQIYGGSPYDAKALGNYLRLSPSFRAPQFAGPLLQLFTQANGLNALELHALLQDQKIPTELVFFPNENHIFWHPRRRAAAMNRSLEWFSFWLKGEKPASQEVAERWNAMRTEWTRGREARK
jgi:dipeptidyl aminopeptidase/acylaminoacyl peptidase